MLLFMSTAKANIYGLLGCGQFLSSCKTNDLNIDCQTQTFYAMGVISALSVENQVVLSGFNSQDNIKYALMQYCRNNPLKDTYDGAFNIFTQLRY